MAEEERVRRGRRVKLMPWLGKDDDMEEALSVPPLGSTPEPEPPVDEIDERESAPGGSRLQEKLRRRSSRMVRSSKIAVFGVAALVLVGCYFGWRAATHVTSSADPGGRGARRELRGHPAGPEAVRRLELPAGRHHRPARCVGHRRPVHQHPDGGAHPGRRPVAR